MTDRVRIRRGKHGVGWVVVIDAAGNWLWHKTWKEAITAADSVARLRADRQRWTGGA